MDGIKKVVGYTTGVFDMFHIGHLNILRKAKEKCDYLIVGVSTDELCSSYKGKVPIIPFEERKAIVEAIKYVDKVCPQEDRDKFAAWQRIGFNVMFVGDDWKGKFDELGELCEVVYLPRTPEISTTQIKKELNESR